MHRVGTLIRRKVQTGDLKVQVMSDSRQLGMCRGAEGETLSGKVLYRRRGFIHINLREDTVGRHCSS